MKSVVSIAGSKFFINGQPTYMGRTYLGHDLSGMLFNSRMIQGVFDDENEETRRLWAYPDTGVWDPDRNTNELCAALPEYRQYGLLAITVGLQGGGSIYSPEVMSNFRNSAFTDGGELKPAYMDRLQRVLKAADDCGMVVIVSLFYHAHIARLKGTAAIRNAVVKATNWILQSGYQNVLLEIANEIRPSWPECLRPDAVHEMVALARSCEVAGRHLPVSCSPFPTDPIAPASLLDIEDFTIFHGNDHIPDELRRRIASIRATESFKKRSRPVIINEDSFVLDNLFASLAEGVSWGYYHQGFGSNYTELRFDWKKQPRETSWESLSGFQTLPVNWTINDPVKRNFFSILREITGG